MFLLNSRHPLLYPFLSTLIPKLRAYFAEFLRGYSALRLNLLNLRTCVGLSTVGWDLCGFTTLRGLGYAAHFGSWSCADNPSFAYLPHACFRWQVLRGDPLAAMRLPCCGARGKGPFLLRFLPRSSYH